MSKGDAGGLPSDGFNGGALGGLSPQYLAHTTEPVPPIFWRLGGKISGAMRPNSAPKAPFWKILAIFLKNSFLKMQQKAKTVA